VATIGHREVSTPLVYAERAEKKNPTPNAFGRSIFPEGWGQVKSIRPLGQEKYFCELGE
jgi:hypothetical protein